jgi:Domain of unknown function (DUF4177)
MSGKMRRLLTAPTLAEGFGMPAPQPVGPPPWGQGESEQAPGGEKQSAMYEYRVIEIREKMIGGKMSGPKLERLLNDNAAQGWQLKAITGADVSGRVGPGGVEGLLVTFERMRS